MDEKSERTWIAYQYPTILSSRFVEPLASCLRSSVNMPARGAGVRM